MRLYTTREKVRIANERDFKDVPGDKVNFKVIDAFVGTASTARKYLKETRLLKDLCLKIGMSVMLLQNMNVRLGWVNETIACIVELYENTIF